MQNSVLYEQISVPTGELQALGLKRTVADWTQMRDMYYEEEHSKVYLIVRVFEIESQSIGMKVYLDPEKLRQHGNLVFTGEKWSVVPDPRGQVYA